MAYSIITKPLSPPSVRAPQNHQRQNPGQTYFTNETSMRWNILHSRHPHPGACFHRNILHSQLTLVILNLSRFGLSHTYSSSNHHRKSGFRILPPHPHIHKHTHSHCTCMCCESSQILERPRGDSPHPALLGVRFAMP